MKRLKFNWLAVAGILLAAVILCGVTMRMTDGFTDFDFSASPNEENLFFEKIEDGALEFIVDVEAEVKDGVITLDGGVPASAANSLTIAEEPIKFASLSLKAGEYTFTAFEDPSATEYFAVGVYEVDGVTKVWLADASKVTTYYERALSTQGYANIEGNTVTFEEDTDVDFYIMVIEGAELKNVEAFPVIVEGAEEGDFYNKSIFDK